MSASLPSHTGDHRERKAAARVARRQDDAASIAEQLAALCPDWRPLEAFARAVPAIVPGEFMWMGVDLADGRAVHLYKHGATRRYISLDDAGHAYRSTGEPLATAAEAVALLELDDPCNYYRENP